jgi:hypothetical protein
MEMIAAFRRPFVIEPMSDVFSDLIKRVRVGLPENSLDICGGDQLRRFVPIASASVQGQQSDLPDPDQLV